MYQAALPAMPPTLRYTILEHVVRVLHDDDTCHGGMDLYFGLLQTRLHLDDSHASNINSAKALTLSSMLHFKLPFLSLSFCPLSSFSLFPVIIIVVI